MASAVRTRETVFLGIEVLRVGRNIDSHIVCLAYYVRGPIGEQLYAGSINFDTKWPIFKHGVVTNYRAFDPAYWNEYWADLPCIGLYKLDTVLVREGLKAFADFIEILREKYDIVITADNPDQLACLDLHVTHRQLTMDNLLLPHCAGPRLGSMLFVQPSVLLRALPGLYAEFLLAAVDIRLGTDDKRAVKKAEAYTVLYTGFLDARMRLDAIIFESGAS